MTASLPSRRSSASISGIALVLVALLMPGTTAMAAAEEIPHENYDLVGADLDVVIALLNASIRYSESAYMALYNESMAYAEQNLSGVRTILIPAQTLLTEIEDVASSYENLSTLIPPFAELSSLSDEFASAEGVLLDTRDEIIDASLVLNLTGQALIDALDSIKRFNELMLQMNGTIDRMLVYADRITALTVEDETPFEDNQLSPLIEKLRDLLHRLELEVNEIINNDVPWEESEPFLLLWISSPEYYLGDTIVGGGYLFFSGAFAAGYTVRINFDGALLITATTATGGRFYFAYEIPKEADWVGAHTIRANATTPVGVLNSAQQSVRIFLIPTTIFLDMSEETISIEGWVSAHILLLDFRGNQLSTQTCRITKDATNYSVLTDGEGTAGRAWQATELGFGTHYFRAYFDGAVPYAPDVSSIEIVVVDIPTTIDLRLFLNEYRSGYSIVGNGTLYANGTQPMAGQIITLFIDGTMVANVTTAANGEFAFSLSTDNITAGGHTLKAALLFRDLMWRYCQDQESFTLKGYKEGRYPFWPIIPGWGGLPSDLIPYLFIGKNAYFFWLLVLAFAGVTIRVVQMRKKRAIALAKARSETLSPIDGALLNATTPVAAEELAFELPPPTEGPANPNERIIWYYQRLLAFLIRKGLLGISPSMTHREVARVMKAIGYPTNPVEDATMLFEQALYSGAQLTDEDSVLMSSAMTKLVRPKPRGAADAV